MVGVLGGAFTNNVAPVVDVVSFAVLLGLLGHRTPANEEPRQASDHNDLVLAQECRIVNQDAVRITEILESVVEHHLLILGYRLTSHVWIAFCELQIVVDRKTELRF